MSPRRCGARRRGREGVEEARRALPDCLFVPASPKPCRTRVEHGEYRRVNVREPEQQSRWHSCRERRERAWGSFASLPGRRESSGSPRPAVLPRRARGASNPRLSRWARAPKARRVSGVWGRTAAERRPSGDRIRERRGEDGASDHVDQGRGGSRQFSADPTSANQAWCDFKPVDVHAPGCHVEGQHAVQQASVENESSLRRLARRAQIAQARGKDAFIDPVTRSYPLAVCRPAESQNAPG